MPNTIVLATGEALPKKAFDRAAIMKAAWASYNLHFTSRPHLKRAFNRDDFAWHLHCAWEAAKLVVMSSVERRRFRIRQEIAALKYKSFQINTAPIRMELEAELAALAE